MTKSYHVKITVTAERDIAEIWDYIARDSEKAADRFIDTIEEKITSLASFPERNPFIPESFLWKIQHYRHLVYHRYRIIYRIEEMTVYVLRVFHGARTLDIDTLDQSDFAFNYSFGHVLIKCSASMKNILGGSSMSLPPFLISLLNLLTLSLFDLNTASHQFRIALGKA